MANFADWINQDLQEPARPEHRGGLAFTGDNRSVLVGVHVTDDGAPADLSGSVVAHVVRSADGGTVTFSGLLDGSDVSAVLPEACFAYPGRIAVMLQLVDGTAKTTLCRAVYDVVPGETGTSIDPGSVVPDLSDILAMLDEMEQATEAAQAAAGLLDGIAPYNTVDLLALYGNPASTTVSGVQFTLIGRNKYRATGTATATAYANVYHMGTGVFVAGKTYNFRVTTTDATKLRLAMFFYDSSDAIISGTSQYMSADRAVTVPAGAVKTSIYVQVPSGATVNNAEIEFYCVTGLSNAELDAKIDTTNTELNANIIFELLNGNSLDILRFLDHFNVETRGVTYAWNSAENAFAVSGTATGGNSVCSFYANISAFPYGMATGRTYRIKYSSVNVYFQVLGYNSSGEIIAELARTKTDASFTIPQTVVGVAIRLFVENGTTVNEIVSPVMLTEYSNTELAAMISELGLESKGVVPDGTDLDTIREQGLWFLNSGLTYTHAPFGSVYGGMMVVLHYDANNVFQIVSRASTGASTGEVYFRSSFLGNFPETWRDTKGYFHGQSAISGTTDIDTVKETGLYQILADATKAHDPYPGYSTMLFVYKYTESVSVQIAMRISDSNVKQRVSIGGVFGKWVNANYSACGVVPTNTDLNTVKEHGIWFLNSGNTYTHSPFNSTYGGMMLVIRYDANNVLQIVSKAYSGVLYSRSSLLGNFPETWSSNGTSVTNNYTTEHYENTYDITCAPTITTDTNNYLASTGDSTDRTGAIQTMLNTTGVCRLGPGMFYVKGVTIPSNAMLIGSGNATVVILDESIASGYAVKLLTYGCVKDLKIRGTVSASPMNKPESVGTRHGILFEGTSDAASGGVTYYRSTVQNCMIHNFTGGGITMQNTGLAWSSDLIVANCSIHRCGAGINIPYFSEFHRVSACTIQECLYGIIDNGGNNNFVCCDISGNNVGILIDNSQDQSRNNSHGTFSSCSVNHSYSDSGEMNKGIAIKLLKAVNGEIFTGMQIFYGAIVIDKSVGVRFIGANIGRNVPITVTDSTVVTFSDCTMQESPTSETSKFTGSNNTVMKFTDCYLNNGTVYNPA